MPEATYQIGQTFPVQFVWHLPNGDFLRAVFEARVVDFVPAADKYVVDLTQLIAGRQETEAGNLRPTEEFSDEYWALVGRIVGQKISVAYEAGDGRPLHLRLATLTGKHNFFYRFGDAEQKFKNKD